jgi:hypothetical protein
MARQCLVSIVVLCALLACAVDAPAAVYWGDRLGIGRANLDGSGLTASIADDIDGAEFGMALSRDRLYYATLSGLAWVALDGERGNKRMIDSTTAPRGVATDATHVYWAEPGSGTINRADLDGTHVVRNLVTGLAHPCSLTLDATYIYWTNCGPPNEVGTGTTIGRAKRDGSGADDQFITGASGAAGVTVDAAHIYWANYGTATIGRADLDGSDADQGFIVTAPGYAPNPDFAVVHNVAVLGDHLYWDGGRRSMTGEWTGVVGRARTDGNQVELDHIATGTFTAGMAVDAYTPTHVDVSATPDHTIYGEDVAIRAQVSAINPPAGVAAHPAGALQLVVEGEAVGAPVPVDAAGRAELPAPFLFEPDDLVEAVFAGDATFAPSTGDVVLDMAPAATRTSVTVTPNPATVGATLTATARVENTSGTGVTPFGTIFIGFPNAQLVTELDDAGLQTALIDTTGMKPGTHSLAATFIDQPASPRFTSGFAIASVTLTAPIPAKPATPPPAPTVQPAAAFKLLAAKTKAGRIALTLTAPTAGRFTAKAKRGSAVYGTGKATASKPGTVKLTIAPTRAAKAALRRKGRLRVTVAVRFQPRTGPASTATKVLTVRR